MATLAQSTPLRARVARCGAPHSSLWPARYIGRRRPGWGAGGHGSFLSADKTKAAGGGADGLSSIAMSQWGPLKTHETVDRVDRVERVKLLIMLEPAFAGGKVSQVSQPSPVCSSLSTVSPSPKEGNSGRRVLAKVFSIHFTNSLTASTYSPNPTFWSAPAR